MFNVIKTVCEVISCGFGNEYSKSIGKKGSENNELTKILECIKRKEMYIENIAAEYGIIPEYGETQSGAEINGKYIEFIAFTQKFEIRAIKLLELINILEKAFEVKFTKNELTISPPKTYQNEVIKTAQYFVSSDKFYAVDIKSKELGHMKGKQLGGASCIDDCWKISINIEDEISLATLIDEIIHAKLPKEVQQQHINIDLIGEQLTEKFIQSGYNQLLKNPVLEEEKKQIFLKFKLFNNHLEKEVIGKI